MNASFLCVALLVPGYGEKDILQQIQAKGGVANRTSVILAGAEDADLGDLCELPNLKELIFCRAKITDKGLHTVAGLRGLTHLVINEGSITDKGLRELELLSKLRFLSVDNCPNITAAGIARLEKGAAELLRMWPLTP